VLVPSFIDFQPTENNQVSTIKLASSIQSPDAAQSAAL